MTKRQWTASVVLLVGLIAGGWVYSVIADSTTSWSGNREGSGLLTITPFSADAFYCDTIDIDSSLSSSGTITAPSFDISTALILANDEEIANATDAVVSITADDDAVELLDLQLLNDAGATADNDYIRQSFWIQEDDDDTQKEMFYVDVVATDVTSTTEDARVDFGVMTAGTLADEWSIDGSALFPATEGGASVGKTGYGINNLHVNGNIAATTGSTSLADTAMTSASIGSGTQIGALFFGQDTIASGATSQTVVVAGFAATDTFIVTPNEDLSTGTIFVTPGSGSVTVHIWDVLNGTSASAGEDYDFSYIAILND